MPRARLRKTIAGTPNLDWLLLTKRPEYIDWADMGGPNVWWGTSVESNGHRVRIPYLVANACDAPVRFLSVEPMLGPVDLTRVPWLNTPLTHVDVLRGGAWTRAGMLLTHSDMPGFPHPVNWVIIGGESGHHARPFEIDHARLVIAECRSAGVPVFVKQLGSRPVELGTPIKLRHPKGEDPSEWPSDMQIQEFPDVWQNNTHAER